MSVIEDIKRFEGWRGTVYDDATGLPITPGALVKGVPTIGWGTNLMEPISKDFGDELLAHRVDQTLAWIVKLYPWFQDLDSVRKDAVTNMGYNLGQNRFALFVKFITAMQAKNYKLARVELENSLAYKQAPERYIFICKQIAEDIA